MFINGPIKTSHLNESLLPFQQDVQIGAYTIFMGQIRADKIKDIFVEAIDYSAYPDMAIKVFEKLKLEAYKEFDVRNIIIRHSLGKIKVGEASLMIIVGSAHRKSCQKAQEYILERIKKEVPIFGKEIFEEGDFKWKENN